MTSHPPYPRVFLEPRRDGRLEAGHPWVYSNEIRMDKDAKALPPGSLVALHRVDGKPLGVGTFNPHTLIAFRRFDRDPAVVVDRTFLRDRLERALRLREKLFGQPFYRLVHGEADRLPGLVVDRFGDVLSVQAGTAGSELLQEEIVAALDETVAPAAIVLRNDGPFRRLEGLESYVRMAKGALSGPVPIREGTLTFLADPESGQKTGWFFDQRDNRAFVASLAKGGEMLDLYCYGGGFGIAAAVAGAARVTGIDGSEAALVLAREAASRNGVGDRCQWQRGEVFEELERLRSEGARFDLVAADPPAFVKSRKDLGPGLKGYRKLARLAATLPRPGGFLFIASCSHNVEPTQFAHECARGIAAAGRTARILRSAGAAPDHPVLPELPESAYLKALVFQVD